MATACGSAEAHAQAEEHGGLRMRWTAEHVDKDACAIRAKKVARAPNQLLRAFYSNLVVDTAKLINCPVECLVHQLSPSFGAAAPYTRASRWHHKGVYHIEPLNFQNLLGADSGVGKSQAQREIMKHVVMYEKTSGRNLIARNMTIESLESRMHTNAHLDDCLVKSSARQGSAMVMMDEAAKLVSLGQYKAGGKGDHRERWMEAANGELVKTDRKGSGVKMAVNASKSSSSQSQSEESVSTPGEADEDEGEEGEEFVNGLRTEQYYAHLNSILFTHPHRIAGWTWDEQAAEGTDGWTVRLKTMMVDAVRKPSAGRNALILLAESKTLETPLYHLLVASHIICENLPEIEGIPFKLLEFDDECEEGFVKWEAYVVERINELKESPAAGLQIAVYSKSIGDLVKETGISGLMRLAEEAVKEATDLKDYVGTDMRTFRTALNPVVNRMINTAISAGKVAKDQTPRLLIKEDMTLGLERVQMQMETAFALMKKNVLGMAPAPMEDNDKEDLAGGAGAALHVNPDFGRHDLHVRQKKPTFKIQGQPFDNQAYLLHIVLTAPRVAKCLISVSALATRGAPRIYAGTSTTEGTAFALLAELQKRGLATQFTETIPAKKELQDVGLRAQNKRHYIRVVDLHGKSNLELQGYENELSKLSLTVALLKEMNDAIAPLNDDDTKLFGTLAQVTSLLNKKLPPRPAAAAAAAAPIVVDGQAMATQSDEEEDDEPASHLPAPWRQPVPPAPVPAPEPEVPADEPEVPAQVPVPEPSEMDRVHAQQETDADMQALGAAGVVIPPVATVRQAAASPGRAVATGGKRTATARSPYNQEVNAGDKAMRRASRNLLAAASAVAGDASDGCAATASSAAATSVHTAAESDAPSDDAAAAAAAEVDSLLDMIA